MIMKLLLYCETESLLNTQSCHCDDCFCNVLPLILEEAVFYLTEAISSNVQHIIYNNIEILIKGKDIHYVCLCCLFVTRWENCILETICTFKF